MAETVLPSPTGDGIVAVLFLFFVATVVHALIEREMRRAVEGCVPSLV